jgi:hypothetical protein
MCRASRSAARRRQSGQALVLVILMFVVLIGAVGLSIDIGVAVSHQRTDQSVADSAALAAADRLSNGQTIAVATSAATSVATLAGVPSGNLTMNYLDGSRNPTTNRLAVVWIQAKVAESVPTFFFRAIGVATANVAALAEVKYPKRCALCLLDLNAAPALDISSSGGLTVTGDCLQVNSSAGSSVALTSGGGINAPCTNLVGGVSGNPALITPAANSGVAPVPDPLAKLPYPTGGPACGGGIYPGDTNTVINPGCYTEWALGGLGNLYLNPGTYVLAGPPGVSVSSTGGIKNCTVAPCPAGVSAGGVTLFFTCTGYNPLTSPAAGPICPCPTTYGADLVVSSNGGINITAPTSGTYQGVAIFFDRCNNGRIALTANGGVPVTGAIYAKASPAYVTANGNLTVAGLFITATMQISASGNVKVAYDPTDPAQQVQASWLNWGSVRLYT